jgi:hypothetical protein
MKCEKCRWYKIITEQKKKYNKAWNFKVFDGVCMFNPQEVFKQNDDFCNHFEEIADEDYDKNKSGSM